MAKKRKDYIPLIPIIIFIVIPILSSTFYSNTIVVELDYDGTISPYFVEKSYWGLKKDLYLLEYRPETNKQVSGWYYINNDGQTYDIDFYY